MNRDQSYTLIRQTFTQGFDKARFQNFAVNLLNWIDESKAQGWNSTYVKDAFKTHVNRYERLGTYTSPDNEKLDVLIVHLTKETKLARARTAIRNFVAHHLKTRDEKDAALVAFVSPTEKQWRLSYVKMEYATVEKESGKVGVETRLTPARRFSYIVGEGESCHTAQTRFLSLLQDTKTDPKLADIEEAFSVEAVTKEFFKRYVELFENIHLALDRIIKKDKSIHEEFQSRNINTVDFAKKLMGQIVFLYFLQKKGWLGVEKGKDWGTGPHDFLRRLARGEYGSYENYFNDVLEPLFYDTLATDRGHEAWCRHFKCRIPFLNGGLFEALGNYNWKKTDIFLPNRLFTNNDPIEEGITGSGVLDVFDRYNFTVNEAEPLEKEVAIDPEMLGKVFENLIEENRRKSLGAIYTPREIVHNMCQESLINYLDTSLNKEKELVPRSDIETFIHTGDQASHYEAARMSGTKTYKSELPKSIETHARLIDDKLQDITACDPAVGSGAFPVGMMTEIVRTRLSLTPYFNDVHERTPYFFKRHAIQNCLYGVDIDAGAVAIAKLRLWLSLVVDEEDVEHINPLPNLDYKIVVGNSLLGFPFKSQRLGEIEKLKQKFFDETDNDKKAQWKTQIDQLLAASFASSKKTLGYEVDFDFQVFFSEVFQRKGGFDVMLANPPYVGEKGHKEMFRLISSGPLKPFYQGKMDLFYFFFHLALNLSREHGHIAFITTNYYITASGAKKLRQDLKNRSALCRLINFNELKIFESALGQHNMITLLSKTNDKDVLSENCVTKRTGFATPAILQNILSRKDAETDYFTVLQSDLYDGDECYIRPAGQLIEAKDGSINQLLNRLALHQPLIDYCKINSGCDVTISRITARHLAQFRGDFAEGDGVFVLDTKEIQRLHLDRNESCKLKHYIKNSDIQRYGVHIGSDKLVYFRWEDDVEQYPILKRHLARFKTILLDQAKRYEEDYPWFALHRPRNQSIFDSEQKILVPYRSKSNLFGYTTEKVYSSRDVFFITPKDETTLLKYVLALINSRPYYLWLYHRGKRKGETLELYQQPLSEIPIKRLDKPQQKPFVDLVDRILITKQRNPDADVSALEREIDRLVYRLYDLTPDEIAIAEGKSS